MIRIIDWNAVGDALTGFLLFGVLGILFLSTKNSFALLLLPASLISLAAMVQKLVGVVLDPAEGTVRFYSFWIRRRILLSEIRDANCEFGILVSPTSLWMTSSGGKGRGRSKPGQRTYMVNLSGDFGSRQVRFNHKRWRDRFLSVLRDHAPRCRITRWF